MEKVRKENFLNSVEFFHLRMDSAEITCAFLSCFADSVEDTPPVTWFVPQGPLSSTDIDHLFGHFIYRTPRAPVLTKFAQDVGFETAYNFLTVVDPMLRIRSDTVWKQTLKYIYKMMAEHKHLTWGILDSDAHYPQVVFHIQDPPNFDDGSDGD
ncbi:MAG: hypothetical protein GY737_29325, partial [Desulfobacteraceae bacterium]|nr:hypothetical protein [Desulfobacteraceae bacterium]